MSRNNGFGTAEAENAKMVDYRFEKLNEVGIDHEMIKTLKTHRN